MSKFDWYVLLYLVVSAGLPALLFFYLSRLVAGSPALLFVCGLLLVLIGAHGLDLLLSLQVPYEQLSPGATLTTEMIAQLKHNRELWVLIFPFVTAAVGTNLMSQAIVHRPSSAPELEQAISDLKDTTARLEKVSSRLSRVVLGLIVASIIYFATRLWLA